MLDTLTEWNKKDPNRLFESKLDLNRVGIFGHSYGGATTAETLATDAAFQSRRQSRGRLLGECRSCRFAATVYVYHVRHHSRELESDGDEKG
ncbi:hypothetical protein [Paenibacillus sp. MER TA 81-3]|uniref:alpha/beta hydrolase n=1 Tax=Paenibacillus sp. MER TA 81-3 TaxID=2939573 RepID=UPI0034D960F7